MHQLPQIFTRSKQNRGMDLKKKGRKPRLKRTNAAKDIEYDAESSSSSLENSLASLHTRSCEFSEQTSFRIEGSEGEFDRICQKLGLGPEDFSISVAAWEARKARSSSDLLPMSRMHQLDSPNGEAEQDEEERDVEAELSEKLTNSVIIRDALDSTPIEPPKFNRYSAVNGCGGGDVGGIKGVRPPMLKPPPSMRLPLMDTTVSTWDMLRDFAPEYEVGGSSPEVQMRHDSSEDDDDGQDGGIPTVEVEVEGDMVRLRGSALESCSSSFTTLNDDDDDSSSTTTPTSNLSPTGRSRPIITYWEKGRLLGRGSFGSVYEGISQVGFFFAVKEVSLLDQGSQGRQSIYQLEHEIALLSQFEHKNIVQYYGTDKDESNLYIFLELVTQGSLMKLYQTYHLRDSIVSAYTKQILHGLKYLHDRNVIHRDIKCANILVHGIGLVKLADFGLAKATKLNDVKSCKGTPFWMAPEVVNNKKQGYGLPADIWSLGCTVLEMLTGQFPYSDLEPVHAIYTIGKGMPPPIPDSLSKDARDFILKCLQVDPNDRPTAAELLRHPFMKAPLHSSSGSASPYNLRRRS